MGDDPRAALAARLTGSGAPFELTLEDHGRGPVPGFRGRPATLADVYARARTFRDKVCLVSEGQSLSYAALFAWSDRLGAALTEAGLARGDRVALAVADKAGWIAAFVAITARGGVAVLVDPGQDEALPSTIARAGCVLGVTDSPAIAAVVAAATGRPTLTPDAAAGGQPPPTEPTSADDLALIAFTSGSSGPPKGVVVDHRGIVTGLRGMLLGGALAPAGPRPTGAPPPPCALVTAPLFHVGGYAQVLLAMMIGGKLAFAAPNASAADLARAMGEHGVTALGGATPVLLRGLLDAGADLSTLRTINVQGAHLPAELLTRLKRTLPEVRITGGYGMTEANGSISVASETDLAAGDGRGFTLPTALVRVIDDDEVELPAGAYGEVTLRGAMLGRGILDARGQEQPLKMLRTGDIGALGADGMLRILDRAENCRRIDGRWLSCREIEAVALGEPAVRAALSVFADEGVEVWVAVDDAYGSGDLLAARLTAALVESLPEAAGPVRLTVLDELPTTASGKVRRPDAHR